MRRSREHHERWDGKGYPRGLVGDEISLAGRIVAVADVFDVITSPRSYKRSGSVADGRLELARCAGTQFDPEVVRAFLAISVRQGRLAAPLAWAAHAAALVRLPATQTANGLSAGAAAAVAVGLGVGAGVSAHHPTAPAPVPAAVRVAPHPQVVQRASARPHRSSSVLRSLPSRPVTRVHPKAHPTEASGDDPVRATPSPGTLRAPAPAPAPDQTPPPSASADPRVQAAAPPPEHPPNAPTGTSRSAEPVPSSQLAGTAPSVPAASPAKNLAKHVSTVTDDVAALAGDAVSVVDPGTPLADKVSSAVDDVGSLTGHVASLLTPPPPPSPPPPPDDRSEQGSLVDKTLSLVGGLAKSR